MSVIEIENVSFTYHGDKRALDNVSLSIEKGEWVSILGHNGSGKSTLSKLIVGLLKPQSGTIRVDGITLSASTVRDIRKRVGIVFQNPDNQFVGVTVRDDIAFGLENLQIERPEMIERIEHYAKKVDMYPYLNKEPHALSGGQKQRVAIAGILAMKTDVIIFDEATAMLDPEGRERVMEFMRTLNREGTTIITITHEMKEAVMSDRIVVLKDGKVLKADKSENILKDKETLERSNLELLLPLEIMHYMNENGIDNPSLKEFLWQLSLNG